MKKAVNKERIVSLALAFATMCITFIAVLIGGAILYSADSPESGTIAVFFSLLIILAPPLSGFFVYRIRMRRFYDRNMRNAAQESVPTPPVRNEAIIPAQENALYDQAVRAVIETGNSSVSVVQRRLGLGYARSARLVDQMEECGVVGPFSGSTPRKVLVTMEQYLRAKSLYSPKSSDAEPGLKEVRPAPIAQQPTYFVRSKIDDVDFMDGYEFEELCAKIFRHMGYDYVEVTKGSGDDGVDVVAVRDGIRTAIQCKRYNSNLGKGCVQEVYAGKAMYNCQVGMVITNQYFTEGAKKLADANGILLRDRTWVIEQIEKYPVTKGVVF